MPIVSTAAIPVENDNSPHTANASGQVDLSLLLSEYYGKNIRQGQRFVVKGLQATLVPANNSAAALDAGISATVQLKHIPVTSHSRRAWNNVFKQWRAQKNLGGAVGPQVRYDDMEFAWGSGKITSRTSTIRSTGIGDSNSESLCLTGTSSGGTDFCLNDYYNTSFPAPGVSRSHFDDSVIKETKFGATPFPDIQEAWVTASNSARQGAVQDNILDDAVIGLTSALSFNDLQVLPSAHQVLCGLYEYNAFIMPDDTAGQIEEDFDLILTFHVVKWTALVYRPKGRSRKGRKASYRSGTWYHGKKGKSRRKRRR